MSKRSRRLLVLLAATGVVAGLGLTAGQSAERTPQALPAHAIPSPEFWATHGESEGQLPLTGDIYEGSNDRAFLRYLDKARDLPRFGSQQWKNEGPFGGVKFIEDIGGGANLFGPVGGIGTAITVDPGDPSGDTAYFGTHGGLWKTTDGGKTMRNISDRWFERAAVGAIAVDPNDSDNVYVGTGVSLFTLSDDAVGTGVYVSHDGGRTFTRPAKNTSGYGVNAITVSEETGTVLVGTNYGLWRSTNEGDSFTEVELPTNANHTGQAPHRLGNWVTDIKLRPGDETQVTLAVGYSRGKEPLADGTVLAPGNGLYRSNNDGQSFQFLTGASELSYAASTDDPVGRASLAYATEDRMWALVQDAGRAAGHQPFDLPTLPAGNPSGGSVLNGLYLSEDNGQTWRIMATQQTLATALGASTAAAAYPLNYAAGAQAQFNNFVLADPRDPDRVYIGLEETFQGDVLDPTGTLPLAMRWTAVEKYANLCGFLLYPNTIPNQNSQTCPQQIPYYGTDTTHPDQHGHAITELPNGEVRMYSGNDGGWWRQNSHSIPDSPLLTGFDNETWTSLNTPATVLPWNVDFLQDGTIIFALQDNGSVHMRKDGSAFNICGGDGVYVFPGVNKDSYYCGIPGQTLLGTTDDWRHTINLSPGTPGASFLSPWASDLTDGNHLIAAASEVRETTAGVNSNSYDPTNTLVLNSAWQTVFTPPPPPQTEVAAWDSSAVYLKGPIAYVAFCNECRPSLSVGSAIVDPSKVNARIATNVRAGCTPKKAASACWHMTKSSGLPDQQISGIVVDPDDARTLYVSTRQYIVLGANNKKTGFEKVLVSHDAGETFTDITGDLPPADAHSIALRDGRLIVATDIGVFTAKVGSKNWSRLGDGLPNVPYRTMKMDRTGRYVLAGAYGRGAWTYDFGAAANKPPTDVPKMPDEPDGGVIPTTGSNTFWPTVAVLLAVGVLLIRRVRRRA